MVIRETSTNLSPGWTADRTIKHYNTTELSDHQHQTETAHGTTVFSEVSCKYHGYEHSDHS